MIAFLPIVFAQIHAMNKRISVEKKSDLEIYVDAFFSRNPQKEKINDKLFTRDESDIAQKILDECQEKANKVVPKTIAPSDYITDHVIFLENLFGILSADRQNKKEFINNNYLKKMIKNKIYSFVLDVKKIIKDKQKAKSKLGNDLTNQMVELFGWVHYFEDLKTE